MDKNWIHAVSCKYCWDSCPDIVIKIIAEQAGFGLNAMEGGLIRRLSAEILHNENLYYYIG